MSLSEQILGGSISVRAEAHRRRLEYRLQCLGKDATPAGKMLGSRAGELCT